MSGPENVKNLQIFPYASFIMIILSICLQQKCVFFPFLLWLFRFVAAVVVVDDDDDDDDCLLYTSPSPRDKLSSRMPSSE